MTRVIFDVVTYMTTGLGLTRIFPVDHSFRRLDLPRHFVPKIS